MYECTLFALDDTGKVLASEDMEVGDVNDAVRRAEARLHDFPRIELWQSFVCVARLHH